MDKRRNSPLNTQRGVISNNPKEPNDKVDANANPTARHNTTSPSPVSSTTPTNSPLTLQLNPSNNKMELSSMDNPSTLAQSSNPYKTPQANRPTSLPTININNSQTRNVQNHNKATGSKSSKDINMEENGSMSNCSMNVNSPQTSRMSFYGSMRNNPSDRRINSESATESFNSLLHESTSVSQASSSFSLSPSTASSSKYSQNTVKEHLGDEADDNNELRRSEKQLVPLSPPACRKKDETSLKPIAQGRLATLRKNQLTAKRRGHMTSRASKLPELNENSELDLSQSSSIRGNDLSELISAPIPAEVTNSCLNSNQENTKGDKMDNDLEGVIGEAKPVVEDVFIRSLGLQTDGGALEDGSPPQRKSLDDLSTKQLESRFISLSMAVNMDKVTVDQRVCIQERQRDISEQNVDKQLQGIRETMDSLNHVLQDGEVRDLTQKIIQHLDVLEISAARMSSRAEVYGAVKQERRLVRAVELMVKYTENLRREREREASDLEEAKKILNERNLQQEFDSPSRRSMSVCGPNMLGRPMRRRSEVVLPKVLGGVGSPSLNQASSMERLNITNFSQPTLLDRGSSPAPPTKSNDIDDEEDEDARSRFQSAVASTTLQNFVTNSLKRNPRQSPSSSPRSSSVTAPNPASLIVPDASDLSSSVNVGLKGRSLNGNVLREQDRISECSSDSKECKSEETAFRKGYEEGVTANLNRELVEIREQQTTLSNSLDDVVDTVSEAQKEDELLLESPSRLSRFITSVGQLVNRVMELYKLKWNKELLVHVFGVICVVIAIAMVIFYPPTIFNFQRVSKPPQ